MAAPFDMGYVGYIHTRALPFLVLLAIASPSIASGRKTGAILAAVVALQIGYQVRLAASYRAFDREAQATELHQVLGVKLQPDGTSGMPLRPDWEIPRVMAR